jgi:hypothetical protein
MGIVAFVLVIIVRIIRGRKWKKKIKKKL